MTEEQRAQWKAALADLAKRQRRQRYRPRAQAIKAGMIRLPPASERARARQARSPQQEG